MKKRFIPLSGSMRVAASQVPCYLTKTAHIANYPVLKNPAPGIETCVQIYCASALRKILNPHGSSVMLLSDTDAVDAFTASSSRSGVTSIQ